MIWTLFPACVVSDNGNMYYVTQREHALKKLNLKSHKVEYIDNPKGYKPEEWAGVDRLFIDNNKLFLFEQNGNRLLEYSLTEKKSRYFNLNCSSYSCGSWAACAINRNKVFAFLSFDNKVIKIDLISEEIKIEEIYPEINYSFGEEKEKYIYNDVQIEIPCKLYSCGCNYDEGIWIFTENKGLVLKYDFGTEKSIPYLLPKGINGCVHAIWKEDIFYILSIDGKVFSWNFQENKTELLFGCNKTFSYAYFGKIAVTSKNIWILPWFGENIYVVDLNSRGINMYSMYPEDFCYDEDPNKSKFYDYTEDEKKYYFAMHSANYIFIIDKESGREVWLKPKEPEIKEKVEYYIKKNIDDYQEKDFGIKGLTIIAKINKDFLDEAKQKKVGEDVWKILDKL